MINNTRNLLTGWLQVCLVSMNTYNIAHEHWTLAFVVSFLISLVWTFNVKAALGTPLERLLYCIGAAFGVTTGMLINSLIH